jgi:hypothetical protein
MPATAYPVQMDGYDPAQQAEGIPQSGMTPMTPMRGGAGRQGGAGGVGGAAGADPQALIAQLTDEQKTMLQQKMASMTPEEASAYLTSLASNWQNMATDAQAKISRADLLRQNTPQGREAGGVYVAANPLEHIASAANNYQQRQRAEAGEGELASARAGETDVRKAAMEDFIRSRALRSPI